MPHLLDVVFTCGLTGLIAAVAVPSMHASREHDQARLAARHLATRLQHARLDALRRNRAVAIRFDPTEVGRYGVYADGDGDGVLQRDIEAGIDVAIAPEVHLAEQFDRVSFRIAVTVPSADGGGTFVAGDDPIRIGATNVLAFSPIGSATSGTLYLASQSGVQLAVRVFGATGRTRVLWFDAAAGAWRDD